MECKKCGGKVYIIESRDNEMDGSLYKVFYVGRCILCHTKFLYTDYYEVAYTGTDCKEI